MSQEKNYSTITSSKMKTNESIKMYQNNLLTETLNNESITLSKILSNRYTNSTRKPISLRNNDVLLTSIFQLPIINNNKKNSSLKTDENKIDSDGQNEYNLKKNLKMKSKKKLLPSKLETHLKDKFYIDVENKINLHLKNKKFIEDQMLHNRIIHMKKFSAFWKSIADYINPILSIQKFKYNKLLKGEPIKEDKKEKVIKHIPKLYTNILLTNKIHKEKIERNKLLLSNLIEIQKSYDFY